MDKIQKLFKEKNSRILSVYLTAGYPQLNDTTVLCKALAESGADIIEIGIPFSDPVADGPTIQQSSEVALKNGMTLHLLFEQLKIIRETVKLPIFLMGYFNPIMQFGVEKFCAACASAGVDGCIIPDLPMDLYLQDYKKYFSEHSLHNIFLVTPQSSDQRIRFIDENSDSFIYAVSSSAVTGSALKGDSSRQEYLDKLAAMKLKNPLLVGFGVSCKNDFDEICKIHQGAIIGSAYIKAVGESSDVSAATQKFIASILK